MGSSAEPYYCDVDAEPLRRYRKGGYHPTHLGDLFKDGRYKILHKLGWGGYGTVWLASDLKLHRHVALKIVVSELQHTDQEVRILQHLGNGPPDQPEREHVVKLLDNFEHEGPNGSHPVLVLELLGPSVSLQAQTYSSNRLPGNIAWQVSKQAVQALDYIHTSGIVHGDLHPGNIVFAASAATYNSDADILASMDRPVIGDVMATYGFPLTAQHPKYLVLPTAIACSPPGYTSNRIKIIDFGQAVVDGRQRSTHCPIVFRAPETFFEDEWDFRVDIWSLACTIFELLVGYPPFDNLMPNKEDLIQEWISMLGNLPEEWSQEPETKALTDTSQHDQVSLTEWLKETYFEDDKRAYFSNTDIETAGSLLQSMMRFRPSERATTSEILRHAWLQMSHPSR